MHNNTTNTNLSLLYYLGYVFYIKRVNKPKLYINNTNLTSIYIYI